MLDKETLKILETWAKDPSKVFEWRTETFQKILLLLNHIAFTEPPSKIRSGTANQLKAAELLMKLGTQMESIRDQVPVPCPNCGEEVLL